MTCRRLIAVETSISDPEVDGLPLLTRLLLFAANSGSSVTDVCTVAMIDGDMIHSEADRLAEMEVIELCGETGRLALNDRRGRRLWNAFTCVREFRRCHYRMVFDPLARALRWVKPTDSVLAHEETARLLPERHRVELEKVPDTVFLDLIREVSPGLSDIFADREDRPVDVKLGPATGTLASTLTLPSEMVMLPCPHTAIDPEMWRFRTDLTPPLPNEVYSIGGPALRLEVSVGRHGQRKRDTATYLFDQVTGIIHKEEDVAGYVRDVSVGESMGLEFLLPARYAEADICEAMASGLLGYLLPERGRVCRAASWLIDENPVVLRRGATEAAISERAVQQATAESGWHFWTSATASQDSAWGR